MFCPYCGKQNIENARFCNTCGKELSANVQQIFCPNCGKENITNATFCSGCGKNLRPLPNLGKMNVLLLIFLVVITFGIYAPVWFLLKRRALNELQSSTKIDNAGPIVFIVLWAISFLVGFFAGFLEGLGDISSAKVLYIFGNILGIIITIINTTIIIVYSFKVRRIFIEHFNSYL